MKNSIIKWLSIVLMVFFLLYMYKAVDISQTNNNEESLKVLKDAILRTSLQCYAIEGFYPPNIKYLEDKYALLVDHNKYFISYNVFASNILPDIEVFQKNLHK